MRRSTSAPGSLMKAKILFVDDDVNLLDGIRRQLRREYDLETASSALEALQSIREGSSYAVIVSDMRMPDMDGVTLLSQLRDLAPDSVRLMLTGNADQETAIKAVNKGEVFRFLNKPCPVAVLTDALDHALEHYRLRHSEQELLQGTVNGAVKLLTELLAMAVPALGNKSRHVREMAVEVARAMRLSDTWSLEMALALADIAAITLPSGTLAKLNAGQQLLPQEQELMRVLPQVSARLLGNIPRLEQVAQIIRYQGKQFDGGGLPKDEVAGENLPLESRILKLLFDLDALQQSGTEGLAGLAQLANQPGHYDPRVMETLRWFLSSGDEDVTQGAPVAVLVKDLMPGHVLASQVETTNGVMLLTAGHKLTQAVIERLQHTHHVHRIKEPILVSQGIHE